MPEKVPAQAGKSECRGSRSNQKIKDKVPVSRFLAFWGGVVLKRFCGHPTA